MSCRYVTALADTLLAEPEVGLVDVYLHGSAALGGYLPSGSDVDVLAVRWPEARLEMSVII